MAKISTCAIVNFITLVSTVSSTGHFFVGLLRYVNTGNLNSTGNCCDGYPDSGGTCTDACDLIFEITVAGLDRKPQTRRWSNEPVSGESISSFSHAVSFNFTRWPGDVNVTVAVFDTDYDKSEAMVDQFHTVFTHQGAELFYVLQPLKGQRLKNASSLTILFRYKCNPTLGPLCFSDCVDHEPDEVCPTLPPATGTDITITDPYCGQPDNNSANCSTSQITTESTSEISTSHNISALSTNRVYLDSGNVRTNPTMTNQTFSNENTTYVSRHFSSAQNVESSTAAAVSTTSSKTISQSTQSKSTANINVSVQETIPGTRSTTTVDPPLATPPTVIVDEGMTYWPAIVGGVLGGLALLAAAGFLIYYNRQKKLQKRQEIYNVNPKVLRKFEEYAENGTSGRADVPLETEQV